MRGKAQRDGRPLGGLKFWSYYFSVCVGYSKDSLSLGQTGNKGKKSKEKSNEHIHEFRKKLQK